MVDQDRLYNRVRGITEAEPEELPCSPGEYTVLAACSPRFIEGALQRGISKEDIYATALWDQEYYLHRLYCYYGACRIERLWAIYA